MFNRLATAILLSIASLQSSVNAQLVTFDQTPAGTTPVDNSPLASPYTIAGGGTVQFFFDTSGNGSFDPGVDAVPIFEAAGDSDPESGFVNNGLARNDIAAPGFENQLGSYFLRQPASFGAIPAPFIVDYDTAQAITSLSGEIWDIDGVIDPTNPGFGTEQWLVEVLNTSGAILAGRLSPLGTAPTVPLDGQPWTFSFTNLPSGVDKIRITFTGTRPAVGLAFNNFSPTVAIPEPSSFLVWILGLLPLLTVAGLRRRLGRFGATRNHAS
jgi:hypothetical protein